MKNLKLLLLEDSFADEQLLLSHLRQGGYHVKHTCLATKDALCEELLAETYDLVISDYVLPRLNGLEAAQVVKKANAGMPFILVSWWMDDDIRLEALNHGVDEVVLKDHLQDLAKIVDTMIVSQSLHRKARQAQLKLRCSEAAFQELKIRSDSIVAAAMDAIITTDNTHHIIQFNRAAERMFGYQATQLLGKPLDVLLPERFHDLHSSHRQALGESGKTGRRMGEYRMLYALHASGSEFPVEVSVSDVTCAEKTFFTLILRDVSQKLKAEELEKKMNLELLRHYEQLQQFGYITSHTIRGPVTSILGLLQIFNTTEIKDPQNLVIFNHLVQTAQKLDNITRELTSILALQQQMEVKREWVGLGSITGKVMQELEAPIKATHLQIITNFEDMPQIYTVSNYLHNIFYQLISNAIKFRRTDVVPILIISVGQEEEEIEITFQDNGMGIDLPRHQDRIFGLYNRFHTHVEGKGLGLHLVKSLAETLSGSVSVQSKLGSGTSFTVYLPLHDHFPT